MVLNSAQKNEFMLKNFNKKIENSLKMRTK